MDIITLVASLWLVTSPLHAKIAFHSNREGNWEVYLMNADGTNKHKLTNHPRVDTEPHWSPDGSPIVFISTRDNFAKDQFSIFT